MLLTRVRFLERFGTAKMLHRMSSASLPANLESGIYSPSKRPCRISLSGSVAFLGNCLFDRGEGLDAESTTLVGELLLNFKIVTDYKEKVAGTVRM